MTDVPDRRRDDLASSAGGERLLSNCPYCGNAVKKAELFSWEGTKRACRVCIERVHLLGPVFLKGAVLK